MKLALAVLLFLLPSPSSGQQAQYPISTEKGLIYAPARSHPLSWWTAHPLRLDQSHDLMLGDKAPDGRPITETDYTVKQHVLPIGRIAGYNIVQINTYILPSPRVIAPGFAPDNDAALWKDLLITTGNRRYRELYALRYDSVGLSQVTKATIYGAGADAILQSYDPDRGNGGGCNDGYWWFDQAGAHSVDFKPLLQAIQRRIPENSTYTSRCWALHPVNPQLRSSVQRNPPKCHACGIVGEIQATYRIRSGTAYPVSVAFQPGTP